MRPNYVVDQIIFICKYNYPRNNYFSYYLHITLTDIRLNGGYNYGRVEIFHNGTWGTVCDQNYWTRKSSSVVCSQLGFTYAANYFYGRNQVIYDSAPVWLAIRCSGNESSIFQCYNSWQENSCSYYKHFGVRCSSQGTYSVPEIFNIVLMMARRIINLNFINYRVGFRSSSYFIISLIYK